MKMLNTATKQITTLTEIRRKLLIGKAGQFPGRSKNPNHINKIFYMLPEIWLPNSR